jgi:chitin synthase
LYIFCAACPEGFNEFFNQRRRWMPSTIANIFDVLSDYKRITEINDDISIFYIAYQIGIMVGTIVGPGMIFLMLVGGFSAAFGLSNVDSLLLNFIPIIIFVGTCYLLDSKIQLFMAQILSAIYALVMMAVMVGILLQVHFALLLL